MVFNVAADDFVSYELTCGNKKKECIYKISAFLCLFFSLIAPVEANEQGMIPVSVKVKEPRWYLRKPGSVVSFCWSVSHLRGAEASCFLAPSSLLAAWGSIRVVLRLFCFSEVAIELDRVVTGVSRNAPTGGVYICIYREKTWQPDQPQVWPEPQTWVQH